MQKILAPLFFLLISMSAYSQTISSVNAHREGDRIVVDYNYEGSTAQKLYLWVSFNGGVSWTGPLKSVEGNVDHAIEEGENQMIWNVTADLDVFFGDSIVFRVGSGTQIDEQLIDIRDGKSYKTAKIGTQVWMAENLSFDYPGSSYYKNQKVYIEKYGRLYSWDAAQHACPKAWHLPSDDEWEDLIFYSGGKKKAGIYLKSTLGWIKSKSPGFNRDQFTALPGGYSKDTDLFKDAGTKAYWWTADDPYTSGSSTTYSPFGMYYTMDNKDGKVSSKTDSKSFGFSVRCISDPVYSGQSEQAIYSMINPECSIEEIPFEAFAYNYIEEELIEWQKQKPTERRSEYYFRTTDEKVKLRAQELAREAEKQYMNQIGKSITWNDLEPGYYNSASETFQLNSELLGRFEIHVPINENPSFRNNWERLKFKDPLFFIEDDKLRLTGLTISNPMNGKSYTYESPDRAKYDQLKTLNRYYGYDITKPIIIEVDNYVGEAQASAAQSHPSQSQQNYVPQNYVYKKPVPRGPYFGKYYALIIAVNEYEDNAITDLDEPVHDADKLYSILTSKYTFDKSNVRRLTNPRRGEIMQSLEDLSDVVTPNDNLLIFFAGHGYWNPKMEIGYWMPADADLESPVNWFQNSSLQNYVKGIKSKHTLVIADACFSGGILKTRDIADKKPEINESVALRIHKMCSRKAMTSGSLKAVPDKSVFMDHFTKRLRENDAKYLSAEELYSNFKTAVLNNTQNNPQYGAIMNTGDEGGDFIFVRRAQPSY